LPNREGSLKFLVFGDFGTGDKPQYELAAQMAVLCERFPAEFVITVGDNLLGKESPRDFKRKFEEPYAALRAKGIAFYASLGNHDSRLQRLYGDFNMGGKTYYSFKAPKQSVKFIALESDYPTPTQMEWLRSELAGDEAWMIPYFHHPIYSSGTRHGSKLSLRELLEPIFLEHNVTVAFAGHDHIYERTKPQQGITHFVVGSGGKLAPGHIDPRSGLVAARYDRDLAFLAVEIDADQMFFNAVSRTGVVVDSGIIERRHAPEPRGPSRSVFTAGPSALGSELMSVLPWQAPNKRMNRSARSGVD
jgi:hypothetical protein